MHIYRLITVLVIGSYLLSPLVIDNWENSSNSSWYQPFVYWLIVILLAAWVEHRRGRDEL